MRVLLLAAALFAALSTTFAAPPPDAAFITMSGPDMSMEAIEAVLSTATEGDGHIYHVMPIHSEPGRVLSGACLIGSVIPSHETEILALPCVTGLKRMLVDPAEVELMGEEAVFAAGAWNFLLEGGGEETPVPGMPPVPDDLRLLEIEPESGLKSKPKLNALSAPGYQQTSEFMIGRIAIGIVLPESSGSGENWSNVDWNAQPPTVPATVIQNRPKEVYNRIVSGAGWWATSGGTAANITLFYDLRTGIGVTSEPITVSSANGGELSWISQALTTMGCVGTSATDQVYVYVNGIRNANNADWGFAVFVADSLNDTDGMFPNNSSAFAYLHGPYMVMTYDNGTTGGIWGILRMHLVFSHEMGHIFGCPDEYAGAWSCECVNTYGYLGVTNGNCANCVSPQTTCVMNDNTQQLCSFTRSHVGWRDSDSDGILDPVDCAIGFPSAYLDYFIQPWWGQSQIKGHGIVQSTPWSSPTRSPVCINKVSAFSSVDGAIPPMIATATDGSFNSDYEAFDFISAPQSDGGHGVAVTGSDNYGNTGSLASSLGIMIDTTPPPAPPPPSTIMEAPYSASPILCTVLWNSGPSDPESGTAGHQVELGQEPPLVITPLASQYVPMPTLQCGFGGLNLQHATAYRAYVYAVNAAGVRSSASAVSGPLTIDLTPPGSPAVMSDSGVGTGQLDQLNFSWSAATEDVSGIVDYRLWVEDQTGMVIVNNLSVGNVTTYTATGLSLTLGDNYRARVYPVNGAGVTGGASPWTNGILAAHPFATISAAKQAAAQGTPAWITGVYVTCEAGDEPGICYIQQGDRSSGIRTDNTNTTICQKNDCVDVAGILQLNALNELYLHNCDVDKAPGGMTFRPLFMIGRSLGGGTYGLQPGVIGGSGLNTIGLFVISAGQVTSVSSGYFSIDDGSGCVDQYGNQGVGVRCGSITPPAQNAMAKVRGICSFEGGYPVILLRQTGDWN